MRLSKINHSLLFWIILISVLLRVGAAFYFGDKVANLPGTYDQISYNNLAQRVLTGNGFTFAQDSWPLTSAGAQTAHWSFLYTFYLVGVYAVFGIHPLAARILQAVLVGILQPLLVYLLGKRLFNPAVGVVAAALTAVYAYFIYYAACLMTEPFYITAILAGLYLAILMAPKDAASRDATPSKTSQRKLAIYLGLCLGAAVLFRQLFILFVPFLFLWIGWAGRRQWRSIRLNLLSAVLIIGAMILPFTIFNYMRFRQLVLLNTNSGFAFFWGNHPVYGTHFYPLLPPSLGTYQDLIPKEIRNLNEAALDQELLRRGIQFVIQDPRRIFLLSLSRIPVYFMFWPSAYSDPISNLSRILSFGLLWPFMLAGLIRVLVKPKLAGGLSSPVFLLLMFVVVYSGIHILSWAMIRYRLPVDAVMLVFASLVLVDIWHFVSSYSRRTIKELEPE